MSDLDKLQKRIGYRFKDISLLKTALTHSSYTGERQMGYEQNNERLEFIGDAYVDAIVGTRLFEIMTAAHEGTLSRFRADVVCESSLAEAAEDIDLGDYLILSKGENMNGGRHKPSILSDAFEALMGAIITDGGFEACRDVVLRLLGEKIELAANGQLDRDFKSKLQELVQDRDSNASIAYVLADAAGPDHNKTFTVDVLINDSSKGRGKGTSKARAEQAAAEDALSKGVF